MRVLTDEIASPVNTRALNVQPQGAESRSSRGEAVERLVHLTSRVAALEAREHVDVDGLEASGLQVRNRLNYAGVKRSIAAPRPMKEKRRRRRIRRITSRRNLHESKLRSTRSRSSPGGPKLPQYIQMYTENN